MTDIDYCTGENCESKGLCSHFSDYLHRKEKGLDCRYPQNGKTMNPCPQYKQKEFYGG